MSDYESDPMMFESEPEMEPEEEEPNEDDPFIDIENQYYETKDLVEEDPNKALDGFQNVVLLEQDKGKWGFKALKKMVKINFNLGNYDQVKEKYKELMTYTKKAVTLNESEKAINSLLDFLASSPNIHDLYEITLSSLKESKNEKAHLRLQLRMAKMLQEKKDYNRLEKHLKELRAACLAEDGKEDPSKASQLIEVLAMEILMHTDRGNNPRKLKELYNKAKEVKSAINAPHITGIIYECGGKMYMMEQNWAAAYTEFFQAFKDYGEVGSPKAILSLKYLVLANMLASSDINPFEDSRAKSFQNKEEIQAMLALVSAYQSEDISTFNRILASNKKTIMEDEFMQPFMHHLLNNIRNRVLLKLISPYTRITLSFISSELKIPQNEVEGLLVALILDKKVRGYIDQINQTLELHPKESSRYWKYKSINTWTKHLVSLQQTVSGKLV